MSPDDTTTLTESQIRAVTRALDATYSGAVELDGGMVGAVYRIDFTDRSPVVLKCGETPMDVEAAMLDYLATSAPLPVPTVHHAETDLLVMEYVAGDGQYDARAARDAAEHLAALHEVSADAYGFDFETLSGPFGQPNPWTDSWIDFFREQRLCHFAEKAREEGTLPGSTHRRVETLAERLEELLVEPDEPALLHGDFWTANVIVDDGAVAAVIDPAIYFGHHELELAYLDPAQSFDAELLDHYATVGEIDEEFFESRRDVYEVFHALENVRFFGQERLDRLHTALDRVGV